MKKIGYKQLQHSFLLASALGLLTACGSGSTDTTNDGAAPAVAGDKAIASVVEASGICYSQARDTLFVVSDRGILYELDMTGKELRKQPYKTSKGKKYDMEGVACDDANGNLLIAIEGKDNVMTINQESFQKTPDTGDIKRPANGILYKDKGGKNGIEGIAYHDSKVYISNQSKNPYPNQDASFIFTIDSYTAPHPKIDEDEIFDPKLQDIAGLAFYHDTLYALHDKNKISKYNITNKSVTQTITLPIPAEGAAFDNSGNIYFASDSHGKVYKYSLSELGIE